MCERAHAREDALAPVLAREACGDVFSPNAERNIPLSFLHHRRLRIDRFHGGDEPYNCGDRDGLTPTSFQRAKRNAGKYRCTDRWCEDRKSTRLNSSHSQISYAVFCLKKKKKKRQPSHNTTQQLTTNANAHQSH